ncbi:MAG: PQQ-binding-like beta-propeller repeat protein [Gammaproteobacteria bacterium]|nr:PQQ-binding-like beta-propeller repeat protein [Gammaproteobacteria bacterium]
MAGFLIPSRRILLISGLLLSLGARPHAVGPVAAGESDWPQFLGPMRNGVYGGPAISGSWPASGPPVLWRKPVGEGFSGTVVQAGRLILFHRLESRERVECLEAQTGRPLWQYDYPTGYRDDFGFDGGPRATPSVWEGKVYTFGAQGVLHCLELKNGRKVWSLKTHEKFDVRKGFFGAACSPLVEDGRLFLNVGGTGRAGLVAFDAHTGRVLWTATDDEASYSSPAMATLGGRRQVLFLTRTGLVSADPKSGEILFRFRWRARSRASVNAATPLTAGPLIFLSASYRTGAVQLRVKGSELETVWTSDESLSNHYSTSVIRGNHLFGFHGRQEYGQSLRCVALETGRVLWSRDGFKAGTVSLAGDRLVVLKENGELLLVAASPQAFRLIAKARILAPTVRAYPALADGRLFVRNQKELVAVDLQPGR